jgi:hypothetical protein
MFEEDTSTPVEASSEHTGRGGILKYVLLAAAVIYVIATLYLMYDMRTRVLALEQKELALETSQDELGKRLHATSSEFKQALTSEVGLTKQQIAERTAELEKAQKAAAAKLTAAQSQQGQQIAAVSGEVSGVKSEVGTDLAATNAKLEHAMGDLGVQSGLIAHNSSELDQLKRKGERNYYDFTLQKNARQPVSTVSLELKKVDPKKSKFTLNVSADDRTIEKKDRTVGEPLHRIFVDAKGRARASDPVDGWADLLRCGRCGDSA